MSVRLTLAAALLGAASASAQVAPALTALAQADDGEATYCAVDELADGVLRARAPALGAVEMLYVQVRFAEDTENPGPFDHGAVAAYFDEASFGQMALVTTYGPVVTLSQTRADYVAGGDTYARGAWRDEVWAALGDAGLDRDAFDVVALRAKKGAPFIEFSGGRGSLGGSDIWLSTSQSYVVTHEIGHNLGLHHADARGVEAGNVLAGERQNYGNRFDIMGRGPFTRGHFGVAGKHFVGWIADDEFPVVTASGTVRIWGLDGARPEAARALGVLVRTPEMTPSEGVIVEVRERQVDRTGDGVLVLVPTEWESGRIRRTDIVDVTPGSPDGHKDAALLVGETLDLGAHDSSYAVQITPTASGADSTGRWVDVDVRIGTQATAAASAPDALPLALAVAPNPSVAGRLRSLRLALPEAAVVRVRVGDALGRVVSEADHRLAPGAHAVPLDARLAPGLYLARVEAGGTAATVRFTVVR